MIRPKRELITAQEIETLLREPFERVLANLPCRIPSALDPIYTPPTRYVPPHERKGFVGKPEKMPERRKQSRRQKYNSSQIYRIERNIHRTPHIRPTLKATAPVFRFSSANP